MPTPLTVGASRKNRKPRWIEGAPPIPLRRFTCGIHCLIGADFTNAIAGILRREKSKKCRFSSYFSSMQAAPLMAG